MKITKIEIAFRIFIISFLLTIVIDTIYSTAQIKKIDQIKKAKIERIYNGRF